MRKPKPIPQEMVKATYRGRVVCDATHGKVFRLHHRIGQYHWGVSKHYWWFANRITGKSDIFRTGTFVLMEWEP